MNEGATGLIVTALAALCFAIIIGTMLGSGHNFLLEGINGLFKEIEGSRVSLGM